MKLSLRNRILIWIGSLIILGLGSSTVASYFVAKERVGNIIKAQLRQVSDSNVKHLSSWITITKGEIARWSNNNYFKMAVRDSFIGKTARKSASIYLEKENNAGDLYESINVVNTSGEIVSSSRPGNILGADISKKDFFKKSLEGATVISDVSLSESTGKTVFTISGPIYDKKRVVGVFFAVVNLGNFNRKYMEPIKVGNNGYAFMYNKDGLIISHPDMSLLLNPEEGEFDFREEATSKNEGLVYYTHKGAEKIAAFKREETTGWTLSVNSAVSDIMAPVMDLGRINLAIAVVAIFVLAVVIGIIVQMIVKSVTMVGAGLSEASNQVASASVDLSSSSQQLAMDASDQASSLQEAAASLEEMSAMVTNNADNITQADDLLKNVNNIVDEAGDSMLQLNSYMDDISKASGEISKIIKAIDEIAFQNNLLALNAAIEAARAGEAGAGFAVVADEVRKLAMHSGEAAQNTEKLIKGTVDKILQGTEMMSETSKEFSQVVQSILKVSELIHQISKSSRNQAQKIEHLNNSVGEMDRVTQQNAANAEESAAASEEMSSQAELMKNYSDELVKLIGGKKTMIQIPQKKEVFRPMDDKPALL